LDSCRSIPTKRLAIIALNTHETAAQCGRAAIGFQIGPSGINRSALGAPEPSGLS